MTMAPMGRMKTNPSNNVTRGPLVASRILQVVAILAPLWGLVVIYSHSDASDAAAVGWAAATHEIVPVMTTTCPSPSGQQRRQDRNDADGGDCLQIVAIAVGGDVSEDKSEPATINFFDAFVLTLSKLSSGQERHQRRLASARHCCPIRPATPVAAARIQPVPRARP